MFQFLITYLGSCCIVFHKVVIMFYHWSCNNNSTSSCYPPEIERKKQFDLDKERLFGTTFCTTFIFKA